MFTVKKKIRIYEETHAMTNSQCNQSGALYTVDLPGVIFPNS